MDFNMDLFNMNSEDLFKSNSINDMIYRPKPQDGKDNVYKAVIRFIPFFSNPKASIQKKWSIWLKNPNTNKAKYIDCPTSIGEDSILYSLYWKLKNSENAEEVSLADNFSRSEKYYSIVQIIKDPNKPDLNGQFKIFQYGKKIWEKLKNVTNDDMGNKVDPFDIFNGKNFLLHVKQVSNFPNYDDSQFMANNEPIMIDGKPIVNDPKNYKEIFEYLKNVSPDLEQYGFKAWTDEDKRFVFDVIDAVLPTGKIKQELFKNLNTNTKNTKSNTTVRKESKIIEEDDDEVITKPKSKVNAPTVEQPKPKKKATIDISTIDDSDDMDDIDDIINSGLINKKPKDSPFKEDVDMEEYDLDDEDLDEDELYKNL